LTLARHFTLLIVKKTGNGLLRFSRANYPEQGNSRKKDTGGV
jgi:hypothetical protein